jgi:hypothetical protein
LGIIPRRVIARILTNVWPYIGILV